MFDSLRQHLTARRERKRKEYWAKMTDERAAEIDCALIYECADVGGNFMETYRAQKAAGLTGTLPLTLCDRFVHDVLPMILAAGFVVAIVWFAVTHPLY